jgi:hypothetical protein
MGTPGQLLNLYFPEQERWIPAAVEREAQIEGVTVTEMYIRFIEAAVEELRLRYAAELIKG